MLCSEAITVNQNSDGAAASILRCKRWGCEICHPYNRKRVIRLAMDGKPNTFLTLTCNPARYETPDEAARDMKRALVLLRRHVKEHNGEAKMPFICVFERTKKGWPHMHIMCRTSWIDQRWLSSEMAKMIGAPIVDIRRIKNRAKAAAYVAKYVGKDPHRFEGCQRWWRSRNYNLAEPDERPKGLFGERWEKLQQTIPGLVATWKWMRYEIVEVRSDYARCDKTVPGAGDPPCTPFPAFGRPTHVP